MPMGWQPVTAAWRTIRSRSGRIEQKARMLSLLKRYEEALLSYEEAIRLQPAEGKSPHRQGRDADGTQTV